MTPNDHRVPIAAPGKSYQAQKSEIDKAISDVLERGSYILGPACQTFEQSFSSWIGAKHGIAVASGTDAISLSLRACAVSAGHGVITAANTAGATIAAIEAIGAIPILADIHEDTMNICAKSANQAILRWKETYPIRAIIPVHMYGQSANMTDVLNLAAQFDLVVVEDGSQAHGSKWERKMVGSFGHAAAFSFYPTKNLGAFGDAGMLVTHSQKTAQQARHLRQYGWQERHISYHQATNSRMDEIQAAILNTRFKALEQETKRRQEIAKLYDEQLCHVTDLQLPFTHSNAEHVYHQYVIKHPKRDALASWLDKAGIDTSVLYPIPIHQQPVWQELPTAQEHSLEITEKVSKEILSIPVHPFLENRDIERVIESIRSYQG